MPAPRNPRVRNSTSPGIIAGALLALLALPGLAAYQLLKQWNAELLLFAWVAISAFCFLAYWADKHRAGSGAWRIPESTLHLLELAGGWPGAFLAQHSLRHKTAKPAFLVVFWLIVALHQLVALDYLLGWRISRGVWRMVAG
jgi:uncharacterized membrane protein YsdA (DUF1294 family)